MCQTDASSDDEIEETARRQFSVFPPSSDSPDPAPEPSSPRITTAPSHSPADITSGERPEWRPQPIGNYSLGPLTEKHRASFAAIGLEEEDYCFFTDHFVGHLWSYSHKPRGKSWFSPKSHQRISHSLLIGHLAGRYHLATYCRRSAGPTGRSRFATDRFVIDLDAHEHISDLGERYDAVIGAFGAPTLLFRSSKSGGLHLHYWLDQQVDLQRLFSPDGQRNLVPRLLAAHGLETKPGCIEAYPRGCYRSLPKGNRIRLAFGDEYRLLDQSFVPLNVATRALPANAADLRLVRNRVTNGEIVPVAFDDLFEQLKRLPRTTRRLRRRSHRTEPKHEGPPADPLLQSGLTGPGQLDGAIGSLAFRFRHEGHSVDEAITMVIRWIDGHHNGCSRTYNRQPGEAYAKIHDRVRRVFATSVVQPLNAAQSLRASMPAGVLSGWESAYILQCTSDGCDLSTGECVDLYKLQNLCFELMRSAKQWVLSEGQSIWNSLLAEASGRDPEAADFERALQSKSAHFWPNPKEPWFVVPIPHRHRVKRGGLSRERLSPMWTAAKNTGLFQLMRKAHPDFHICEAYGLALDFSALETSTFDSIDHLIAVRIPREERRQRYSKYRCRTFNRIERELLEKSTQARLAEMPFERFVRQQLSLANRRENERVA
jgi:hypothetical protein